MKLDAYLNITDQNIIDHKFKIDIDFYDRIYYTCELCNLKILKYLNEFDQIIYAVKYDKFYDNSEVFCLNIYYSTRFVKIQPCKERIIRQIVE